MNVSTVPFEELHDSVRILYPALKFKHSHEQFLIHTGHVSTWSDTLSYNVDTSHNDTHTHNPKSALKVLKHCPL